jgi:hypothetical protein
MHTALIVVGGLAVGAFIGYQFAPKISGYWPYKSIHVRMTTVSAVVANTANNSLATGQLAGASALAPVQSVVAEGQQIYSGLQSLYSQLGGN